MENITIKFARLETELLEKFPECLELAHDLSANIADPRNASPEICWRKIWDKPLYANTRVEIAERNIKKIERQMSGAWSFLGLDSNLFKITDVSPGKKRSSFKIEGMIAQESGIAAHRLLAIQGAADALRQRVMKNKNTPYIDLMDKEMGTLVPNLKKEMGKYWGDITVLHFLTDMGLACKPDIHLVRSVQFLGMELGKITGTIPSLRQVMEINLWVRRLVEAIDGVITPPRIRYVDKILMSFSKHKIIEQRL